MSEKKPCKVLPPVDELSSRLKGAIPSFNQGLVPKVKEFNIKAAFTSATENIKGLVGNLVNNFTDISIGKLPELNLADIDPSKIISSISSKTSSALKDLGGVNSILKGKSAALRSKLNSQIDCIDTENIGSNELAAMQGNLMNNVSIDSIKLSAKDLRDFKKPGTTTMADYISSETDKIIAKEQALAEKGKSNIDIVASHSTALTNLGIEIT